MVRRLVEAHCFQHPKKRTFAQVRFWLRELRTPQLLFEAARACPKPCRQLVPGRPLLAHASAGATAKLERALLAEEAAERARDQRYWWPLLRELEGLRHARRGMPGI